MPQKNEEIQLTDDSDAIECLEALSLLGLRIHAHVHLLTYSHRIASVLCDVYTLINAVMVLLMSK